MVDHELNTPDPSLSSATGGQGAPPEVRPKRALLGQAPTLLVLVALPWCTLLFLLLFNPRYELHLFDRSMPGIALLVMALLAQVLAAVASYAALRIVNSLTESKAWQHSRRVIAHLLIGLAFSALCSLPVLLLVILGPAFIILTNRNMP